MGNLQNLPPNILEFLVYIIGWGFLATGAALLGIIAFMGKSVIGQLSKIREAHEVEFRNFGQQLTAVKDLLNADLNKHDQRIIRLEEWRKHIESKGGAKVSTTLTGED